MLFIGMENCILKSKITNNNVHHAVNKFGQPTCSAEAVADPGFLVEGRGPVRAGVGLRRGCFLVKMYTKMKGLGPVGGVRRARPLDPPM